MELDSEDWTQWRVKDEAALGQHGSSALLPVFPGGEGLSWSSFGPSKQVSCWGFSCLPHWSGGGGRGDRAGTLLGQAWLGEESYAGFGFQWAR